MLLDIPIHTQTFSKKYVCCTLPVYGLFTRHANKMLAKIVNYYNTWSCIFLVLCKPPMKPMDMLSHVYEVHVNDSINISLFHSA